MFTVLFSRDVENDLKTISVFYRNKILDEIKKQLTQNPTSLTKNKKVLVNLIPPWEADSKVWEMRVGEYRVFYDVDESIQTVFIRAIRKKPPGITTEEIL